MGRSYKATIITPFHNTDLSIFKRTFRSVKSQTIGFENIEWIIVLHNCAQEYIDGVKKLTGGYDNVVLKELVNDAKSAASPRNYGIQFVTSPYIEFLDSDDRINSRTIERCLEAMEKHHADMIVFRMAYEKQNESVQALLTDITLWNPMEEEIVLTGDGLRCKELFTNFGGLVSHNRFTSADFIKSNHLTFDEQVTMGEDGYFTLTCYAKAQKLVVLPRFIGHYYFVNSASAVQSMAKPREAVLHFGEGFIKMFDLLLDIKAYYNHFFLKMLELYIIYAHNSPDFTADDWQTLREQMTPYAKLVTPPPVSKFFPTAEDGEALYQLVVQNILDPAGQDDTAWSNGENVLTHILRNNRNTAFGRHYGFEKLSTIDEYRSQVPLYDYDSYGELIRLYTEVGESDLLTSKKTGAYVYDFNESSKMRMVPLAAEICDRLGQKAIEEISGETTFLMAQSLPKAMPLNDGSYADSAAGIMVRKGIERFVLSYKEQKGYLTAPSFFALSPDTADMDYINLLLALRNRDVTQICGSNTWIVVDYLELFRKRADDLCRDIENGRLSIAHDTNDRFYRGISALNTPDPERARQIREAVSCGQEGRILKLIWPKLRRVLARSGGNFNFYTRRLRRYLGDVRLELDDFITPFGIIAEKTETENVFRLDMQDAFYEFLPCEEGAEPVLKSELKTGKAYELILSNDCGIYRMRTSIFIRPVCVSKDSLLFEECMKPLLIKGQPVCEDFEGILEDSVNTEIHDYFYYYDSSENRIRILIEPEERMDGPLEVHTRLLQLAAPAGLAACKVETIEKGTMQLWRDIRRELFHAPAECFQPVHEIDIEHDKQLSAIVKKLEEDKKRK